MKNLRKQVEKNIIMAKARIILFLFLNILSGACVTMAIMLGYWLWVFAGLFLSAFSIWRVQINIDLIIHYIEFFYQLKSIENDVMDALPKEEIKNQDNGD